MTNPTRQPYSNSPHPSTFLWAHELRRENIQLVNQIDGLRAELAAANDTIASLNRSLKNLELRAREENARLENSLKGLEARFDTNLQSGFERVEDLQAENRQLRSRIDGLEKGCQRSAYEQKRMEDGIRVRLLDEVREMLLEWRKDGVKVVIGGDREAGDAGSDVLVPDSMPVGSVPAGGLEIGLSSTLSDTTWGTPSLVDEGHTGAFGLDLYGVMKQGGRSLAEYMAAAEGIKLGLQTQRGEGEVVRAVVRGLDDGSIQTLIEEEMSRAGWTWNALRDAMLKVIQEREPSVPEPVMTSKTSNGNVKLESTNAPHVQRKRQRARRFIPIVPADEEDERIVMEMYRR
ncbi:hypothetical protein ABHI18_004967 [Aspergillus niger]